MSAGSTNRSALRAGMRSRASAARLVPPARIGWTVTTASAGGPSRVSMVSIALPSRSDRIASSSPPTAATPSACRAACEFACAASAADGRGRSSCAPSSSSGLRARILRRVPVVLHDAPVVVDPENEGTNGRGEPGGTLSAPTPPAEVPWVSAIPASWESVPFVAAWPRLAHCLRFRGPRRRGALRRTPLPGALAPRALPFADMPDVMCCLLMASLAALMSIMGHGRHVQTGVPMTHLNP